MNEQIAAQKLLQRKLIEFQSRNSAFSIRALAKRLGMQPSATNEILKGTRRISKKMALRLAERLQLDPSERANFLGLFPDPHRPLTRKRSLQDGGDDGSKDLLRLTSDQFDMISDWVHYAILSLIETKDAKSSASWMARRLGVSENKVNACLKRLQRLQLIRMSDQKKWVREFNKINTPDDVLNPSIQKSHLNDMELARDSLLRDPVELRDFTSMTMPVHPELLPKAKEIVRKAQDEIACLMEEKPGTEVYRLCSYFFPLTQISLQNQTTIKRRNK